MFRKQFVVIVLILALATMACGVNFNVPVTRITTGTTQTQPISVPAYSDKSTVADVTLAFGAGELDLAPGATDALLSGTATYNVPDFKPEVTVDGSHVRIEQGNLNVNGIPNFSGNIENQWDLKLASTPMKLHINAGAYEGKVELGGLSIQDLEISDGASNSNVSFSQPNLADMDTLRYNTGASSVNLKGLANANFDTLLFHSGAGSYTLDFSGSLKRDATVTIESGISSVTITIPEGVSARVSFRGGLSDVTYHGAWQKNGSEYMQSGSGPTIKIIVNMAAGSLSLRSP